MKLGAFQLARSLHKHVKRLKSVGYSHPPICQNDRAWFRATLHDGRRLEVSVRVITLEEEYRDL
jgi:hypothetical protein